MEGGGWYSFAAPLPDAHPRLAGPLLLRPLQLSDFLAPMLGENVMDVGQAQSLAAVPIGSAILHLERIQPLVGCAVPGPQGQQPFGNKTRLSQRRWLRSSSNVAGDLH